MSQPNKAEGATRPATPPSEATSETTRVTPGGGARSPSLPLVITQSAVGAYLTCPRKYWWSYENQIRKIAVGSALSLGTTYHNLLEQVNIGKSIDDAIAITRANPSASDFDRTIAECLAYGWAWRYTNDPAGKIISAEKTFEWKPKSKARWSVAGKIDAIVELPDGRTAVVEYKTTGDNIEPQSDYWRRLLIDRQVSWYVLGARSLGYEVDTVIYDVARKPGLKPKLLKGEKTTNPDGTPGKRESLGEYAQRLCEDILSRPEHYYARQEIPRVQHDLDESREEMEMLAHMIRASRNANRWPRNTNACVVFGKCPYFDPCSIGHDPQTAGTPAGFKRVDDVNAELTINGAPMPEESDGVACAE
jgi:hypothetical protein